MDTEYTSDNILEKTVPDYLRRRLSTNMPFFDELLGGGLVPSVTYMLSGDPGSGKTTLMTQVADGLTAKGSVVLFNSVEQTEDQIVDLVNKIDLGNGFVFERHKSIKKLMEHLEFLRRENPDKDVILILDSISSMANGSIAKAQEIADTFIAYCQAAKIPAIFLVHTTKNGTFAGKNAMKHAFDGHIHITVTNNNDDDGSRVVYTEKNRFAKRTSTNTMLTDRGHVTEDEYHSSMDLMPVLLNDDDFVLSVDDDDDDLIILE
jgi:DNA repair protein RadA/Sms